MTKKEFKPDTSWPFPSKLPVETTYGVERKDPKGNSYVRQTKRLLVVKKKAKDEKH